MMTRKTGDEAIGILLAHPLTFGSGELKCAVMIVTITEQGVEQC